MGLSSALKFFHVVLDLASSKSVSLLALATCASGRSPNWLKFKNPEAPAVKREAEEEWERS